MLVFAAACNPISDWPHNEKGDDGTPVGSAAPGAPDAGATPAPQGPGAPNPVQPGASTGGNASPNTPVLTADAGPPFGGARDVDAGSVASAPGGMDAGTTGSGDAGAFDAGSDGGVPEAGPSEASVPDARVPDASTDAGCAEPDAADAGLCPGYGCRASYQQLRFAMMDQVGACSSVEALAVACEGRLSQVALQCTQTHLRAFNVARSVSSCLKQDPKLAQLGPACLECYADEAACTISRCTSACRNNDSMGCQACRRQQCSAPLELCTGLPTP